MTPSEAKNHLLNSLQGKDLEAAVSVLNFLTEKEEHCIKQSKLIDQITQNGITCYEKEVTKLKKLVKYWEEYSSYLQDPDNNEMPIPDVFYED